MSKRRDLTEEESKAAKKAYDAQRYQAKKEQILAQNAEWKQNNKEAITAYKVVYNAEYYQENKEEILAKRADYYQENKEEILAKIANYQQENKEKIAARKAEYSHTLKGMCVQKAGVYRAKDRKYFGTDEGSVTSQQMQELIEAQPHCFYCGETDFLKLGLDRIDNNRPHTVDNCVVACWNCNNERRRMPFEEFLKIKGLR